MRISRIFVRVAVAAGNFSPLEEHPVADATIEVVGVQIVQTVCQSE